VQNLAACGHSPAACVDAGALDAGFADVRIHFLNVVGDFLVVDARFSNVGGGCATADGD